MAVGKEPNYLYLTIGFGCRRGARYFCGRADLVRDCRSAVAGITFTVTAWFVIESKRQFVLVGALGLTALLPFVWLVQNRAMGRIGDYHFLFSFTRSPLL